MGMLTEGQVVKYSRKILSETERTNELLTQLLAEAKHANELTRWQQSGQVSQKP